MRGAVRNPCGSHLALENLAKSSERTGESALQKKPSSYFTGPIGTIFDSKKYHAIVGKRSVVH